MEKRLGNEAGFGLLQTLVGSAILIVVLVGLSRVVIASISQYRQLSQADESERVLVGIRDALASEANCARTFGIQNGIVRPLPSASHHFEIQEVVTSEGRVIANKDASLSGAKISKFEVMPALNKDSLANTSDGVTFVAQIRVTFERGGHAVRRSLPVSLLKDASGANFKTCVSGKSFEGRETMWILETLKPCDGETALAGIDARGNAICEAVPRQPF